MPRFNATILDTHPAFATGLFNTLNAGQSPSPDQVIELANLTGALNYWKANPDKFVPVPTPGPGPVPGDPIAAFRARQAVSQNCAWVLLTSQEHGALADAYGIDVVKKYVEFYTVGGSGALGVNEQPMGGGYSFVKNDQWVPDLNQAADAYVQEQATAQGRTVPAPLP